MVALPHKDITGAALYSLRQAVARSLGNRPGDRLACITVISTSHTSHTSTASDDTSDTSETSETSVHRACLIRQWAQPLGLPGHQSSCHLL